VHAGRHGHGRPARRELLEHLQVDLVRLAPAADLLGVGQPEQPRLAERREQALRIGLGPLVLVDARRELLVREVAGQVEQVLGLLGGQQPVDGHRGHSLSVRKAVLEYR
jgi:hypothetical protein